MPKGGWLGASWRLSAGTLGGLTVGIQQNGSLLAGWLSSLFFLFKALQGPSESRLPHALLWPHFPEEQGMQSDCLLQ